MVQRQLGTEGLFAFRGFRASPPIVQADGAASDLAGLRDRRSWAWSSSLETAWDLLRVARAYN